MGILRWLKQLIPTHPPRRDIARLDADDEDDLDIIDESVDLSGGPLKPHHLRKALRDPRLLPKKRRSKKKLFTQEQAGRLFSETLRTRNRKIRDLLPDEDQLNRYGLPVWKCEADIAQALELSVKELRFFSIHRQMETCPHYFTFAIPKRNGDKRLIMAPKRRLKRIQRRLNRMLVQRLPVSAHAHGFLPHRSIRTGAEPHVGRKVVIHLDIKDFFPSVTFARVRGLFIALGYGYPEAAILAVLMTEAQRQPVEIDGQRYHVPVGHRYCVQGAPTSPGICNAIVMRMDRRLGGLARQFEFNYTRYADDITFSGDDPDGVGKLLRLIRQIVESEGFVLNQSKTRIMRQGRRQTVTGVTVNQDLGLSRRERRRIRAQIHQMQKQSVNGEIDLYERKQLKGKLAHLRMLNPKQAEALTPEGLREFQG